PEEDDGKWRGDSNANLLYHALAMSQVISSPPTLARWQRRGVLSHLAAIFFVPVVVYAWVLIVNYITITRGRLYGLFIPLLLALQTIILLLMTMLARSCWLHSRAMGKKWEQAFFRVNPQLRR